jgi:hypothetical protein
LNTTPLTMRRTFIKGPTSNRLIFTMSDGTYLGSIEFDTSSSQAALMIAKDFQAFVSESIGGIMQLPPGATLRPPPNGR